MDIWIKLELNPYENTMVGYVEKFNDYAVLNLSIILYLFTDMVPNPDTKYLIGWIYIGTIGLVVVVNFSAMLLSLS